MLLPKFTPAAFALLLTRAPLCIAQTFQRLGGCPSFGCILPPDQQDFLAGQYFDIRIEHHAPVNGSEATDGKPDEDLCLSISKAGQEQRLAEDFFGTPPPKLEKWNFTWFEVGLNPAARNVNTTDDQEGSFRRGSKEANGGERRRSSLSTCEFIELSLGVFPS